MSVHGDYEERAAKRRRDRRLRAPAARAAYAADGLGSSPSPQPLCWARDVQRSTEPEDCQGGGHEQRSAEPDDECGRGHRLLAVRGRIWGNAA